MRWHDRLKDRHSLLKLRMSHGTVQHCSFSQSWLDLIDPCSSFKLFFVHFESTDLCHVDPTDFLCSVSVSWCCILTWEDVGTRVLTLCVFFSRADLVSRPFPICSRMSPLAPRIQNDNFVRPGHQPSLDRQRKLKNLKNKSVRWGKIRWVFILSEAEIWSSHRKKDIKRSINYFYISAFTKQPISRLVLLKA